MVVGVNSQRDKGWGGVWNYGKVEQNFGGKWDGGPSATTLLASSCLKSHSLSFPYKYISKLLSCDYWYSHENLLFILQMLSEFTLDIIM